MGCEFCILLGEYSEKDGTKQRCAPGVHTRKLSWLTPPRAIFQWDGNVDRQGQTIPGREFS